MCSQLVVDLYVCRYSATNMQVATWLMVQFFVIYLLNIDSKKNEELTSLHFDEKIKYLTHQY